MFDLVCSNNFQYWLSPGLTRAFLWMKKKLNGCVQTDCIIFCIAIHLYYLYFVNKNITIGHRWRKNISHGKVYSYIYAFYFEKIITFRHFFKVRISYTLCYQLHLKSESVADKHNYKRKLNIAMKTSVVWLKLWHCSSLKKCKTEMLLILLT